jgi:Protein of unknown function (DUF3105)
LAKKARTPRPPVQAPKVRSSSGPSERNARLMLYGLAGSGVVVLAAVVVFIAVAAGGSSGDKNVADALKAAGCTYKVVKGDSAGHHVTSLNAKIKYNTFPPSSGTHYFQPAVWDFYTDPVNPVQVVHNEEHGGVIIWWGPDMPASTVEKLRNFYSEDPVSMLGTPIAGLGKKIALTAWTSDSDGIHGRVAICPRFDEKAFAAFRDAFRGKGPEGVPVEANQPGT